MHTVITHIILIGIIFALFFMATAGKINGREVALLIDSASPGMSFEISKWNAKGFVQSVSIKEGKVWIVVDGLNSLKGQPYFTRYSVSVEEQEDKFVVLVR